MQHHHSNPEQPGSAWKMRAFTGILMSAVLVSIAPGQAPGTYSDDPRLDPLPSQCGFQAIYLALRVMGHSVSLADLTSGFHDDAKVRHEGLSMEEMGQLLNRYGQKYRIVSAARRDFNRLPLQDQVLILLVDAKQLHYEVAFAGNEDSLLLSMHGRPAPRWVPRSEVWELLRGPVMIVSHQDKAPGPSRYILKGTLTSGIVLLIAPVVASMFRRIWKLRFREENT